MVKRDVERQLMQEEDDAIHIDDDDVAEDERDTGVFLKRNRRNAKVVNHGEYLLSPLSVVYAENYDPNDNKGWVKPIFSSIVYRLPVRVYSLP